MRLKPHPFKANLVAVQQVAGFEWQFAAYFDDGNTAVDGVHIHDTNGSGSGGHLVDEFFVGGGDQDGGVVGAGVIGSDDEAVEFALGHAIDLFEDHFISGEEGERMTKVTGLPSGQRLVWALQTLTRSANGDGADGIGFIGNKGEIARRSQGSGDDHENRKT